MFSAFFSEILIMDYELLIFFYFYFDFDFELLKKFFNYKLFTTMIFIIAFR